MSMVYQQSRVLIQEMLQYIQFSLHCHNINKPTLFCFHLQLFYIPLYKTDIKGTVRPDWI